MNKFLAAIVMTLTSLTAIANSGMVDSVVLQDLISNSYEKVNVQQSNSMGCKNPCVVQKYLEVHFRNIAKEIEKIKRTPKKDYEKVFGTSVNASDTYRTSFEGGCKKMEKSEVLNVVLKAAGIKLQDESRTFNCKLKFSFEFGENVWSEELFYLKNMETNTVISGTFWALGTP